MDSKIFYIKYGELVLKGKNRKNFENQLFFNLKKALKDFKDLIFIKNHDNIIIENFNDKDILELRNIISQISGISVFYEAIRIKERQPEDVLMVIKRNYLITDSIKSFKVSTKRHDKTFLTNSMNYSKILGGLILKNFPKLQVDLKKYDLLIRVEIKKDCAIIYLKEFLGMGGFPLGINGKVLMLISGGIDSPVAAKLLMKKGYHVDFLTFITPPHTSLESLQKVRDLIKIVNYNNLLEISKLFVCNFTPMMHEISHISNSSYQITLMRRYFFRIAEYFKNKFEYDAIATGESLGQVASQTINSLKTIEAVLKNTIVLRPLLIFDKLEIIKFANIFGTYQTSILPFPDACSLFVPANPVTNPTDEKAKKLEEELNLTNQILEMIKKNTKIEC